MNRRTFYKKIGLSLAAIFSGFLNFTKLPKDNLTIDDSQKPILGISTGCMCGLSGPKCDHCSRPLYIHGEVVYSKNIS